MEDRVLPVDVVLEIIVRRVGDNWAETNRQREKTLRNGGVPDGRFQKFRPFRCDKIQNPVPCALKGHRSDQKTDQNNVRENCKEIGKLPRAFHTLERNQDDRQPAAEQAECQSPIRKSDSIVDVVPLPENDFSEIEFTLQFLIYLPITFILFHPSIWNAWRENHRTMDGLLLT